MPFDDLDTLSRLLAVTRARITDGTGPDTSLRHWMEKRGYGSSVTWLESDIARKVIAALMNMVDRKQVKDAQHGCS